MYELLQDNQKIMENMSKELHEKIVGQEDAIKDVLRVAKKMKLGLIKNY